MSRSCATVHLRRHAPKENEKSSTASSDSQDDRWFVEQKEPQPSVVLD